MEDKEKLKDINQLSKSCVHIYCGDGKGKTTAALGLAARAAGRGKKVMIVRFLKNDDSGEVSILNNIPNILVKPCKKTYGFFFQITKNQKKEEKQYYQALFHEAWNQVIEDEYDLLVLDEIMAACNYGLVSEEEVISCLCRRPFFLEVVMTGRNPSHELLEMADYISEIQKRKHPYDRGLSAREGIEY